MRILIESLDARFTRIDAHQHTLLKGTPPAKLFWSPISTADTLITLSVGGGILRSAAMVEQAFLGLTRRLWDDPFEWTLPEKLCSHEAIINYLDEVAETRKTGLAFLASDSDLSRMLPAPEELKPILAVLMESIADSEYFLGHAEAVLRLIAADTTASS
jgi:hypothetical protein